MPSQFPLLGTFLSIDSPDMAEALSMSGLDFLIFDWEHAPLAIAGIQQMIQAMRPPCRAFIRLPEPEAVYVKKAMDTGCDAVIVPQVNSAAIAQRVVEAGKYWPLGNRGVGLSRSTGYGANIAAAIPGDNEAKKIFVQIEHTDAVQQIEEICGVPGVDGIFVGPYDLSASLGLTGQVNHFNVQAAISAVLTAATGHGLLTAIFVATDDELPALIERRLSLVAIGSDLLRLTASARATAALLMRPALLESDTK